jgi:hypothetical protein
MLKFFQLADIDDSKLPDTDTNNSTDAHLLYRVHKQLLKFSSSGKIYGQVTPTV